MQRHRIPDVHSPDVHSQLVRSRILVGRIRNWELGSRRRSAATLSDVVDRFVENGEAPLLTPDERAALVEYLNSL